MTGRSMGLAAPLVIAVACGGSATGGDGGTGGASSGGTSSGGASGGNVTGGTSSGGSSTGGSPGDDCDQVCKVESPPGCELALSPSEVQECIDECRSITDVLPPECYEAWFELAACVRETLEQCVDPDRCEELAIAVEECGPSTDPCLGAEGFGYASGEGSVQVTIGACFCDENPGGTPGSQCSSSSDCAESCCGCSETGPRFGVQACLRGRCAGGREACDEVLTTSPDVCFQGSRRS